MKKLLLSLGALSAVVAPVAAVVACGSTSGDSGQAKALQTIKDGYIEKVKSSSADEAEAKKEIDIINAVNSVAGFDKTFTDAFTVWTVAHPVDSKKLESNEVWNQTPGTRVFHVGFKVDGAAKHGTAGTVVTLDLNDAGSYGFHGLFGFLKHATIAKEEGTMFAVGDKVILNTDGINEYDYTFDTAGVKVFTGLLAKLRGLDASVFSALDADKHPGTALIQTPIEQGTSIQTKALEELLSLLKVNGADKKVVEAWAAPHAISDISFEIKTSTDDTKETSLMEFGHSLFKGHKAPAIGTVLSIKGLDGDKVYSHTVSEKDPWSIVGYVNGESHQADFLIDLANLVTTGTAKTHLTDAAKAKFISYISPLLNLGPKHQTVNSGATLSADFKTDIDGFRNADDDTSKAAIARVKAEVAEAERKHLAAQQAAKAPKPAGTVYVLDEAGSMGPWHAAFKAHSLKAGDKLQIDKHVYVVKTEDLAEFNGITQGDMNDEGTKIAAMIMAAPEVA